jgi:ElaB/YqjD/DUF883 family membrane-anchored ribosome-binding protein
MAEFNRPGSTPTEHQRRPPDLGRSGGTPRPGQGSQREQTGGGGAVGAVTEKAREWASSASEMAGEAKQQVQHWASDAADTAEEAWDSFNRVVSRNVIPSLLIAAGVGFLLGLALQNTSMLHSRSDMQSYR